MKKILSMKPFSGKIKIKKSELNLDLTLLGGQSFRWEKVEQEKPEWRGVAYNAYWILNQSEDHVQFTVYPAPIEQKDEKLNAGFYEMLLGNYFRIDFDLIEHVQEWKKSHEHFAQIANRMKAVRVLDQEPLENIISFICSQNNNIKRISSMINWLCSSYGQKIGTFNGRDYFTFPNLNSLQAKQEELEGQLREAKFGYRAKFIAKSVERIISNGGEEWLRKLRQCSFDEARLELVSLPGIGFKVADCICLMSLNHLEAVPIDTHIFNVAQQFYILDLKSKKSMTPKLYDDIAGHFRKVYGKYAGWAQTVLFCTQLQQFQTKAEKEAKTKSKIKSKSKRQSK